MPTETRGATSRDAAGTALPTGPASGPYVGLRPYEAAERDRFFGRDHDALFLCNKILSARITVFYSQSGLGKSSLLRTLVIPQLQGDGRVIYFDAWSEEAPLAALKDVLAKAAAKLGVPSPDAGAPTLTELARLIATEDGRSLTLVLDQFEEFLTTHGRNLEPLRTEIAELTRALQVDVQVVLSLREEFLAALEPFREQMLSLFQSTYRLEGLTANSLRDAIRLPPQVFNRSCEPDLVERLIGDLRSESQGQAEAGAIAVELPMLQLVCSQLWEEAQRSGQSALTVALYERAGGVRRILDRYVGASMPQRWADKVLAARMMRLLAPPSGVKMAYSADDLAQNVGGKKDRVESLLAKLDTARILQTRHSKHGKRYELQHDAFINVITPWRDQVLARRDRIRQTLATLAIAAGIVLIVAIGAAWNRRYLRALERQSKLQDLVHHVENDLESRPTFNLLLAAAAHSAARVESPQLRAQAEAALRQALAKVGGFPVIDSGGAATAVALSPDGSKLVTASAKGLVIRDVGPPGGDPLGPERSVDSGLKTDKVSRCVMSPGGGWLATSDGVKILRVVKMGVPGQSFDIPIPGPVSSMTFSAYDLWFAVGLDSGAVEVWTLSSLGPQKEAVFSPPMEFKSERLYAIAFGPSDDQTLFGAYEGHLDDQRQGVVLRWSVGLSAAPAPKIWWKERTDRGYVAMTMSSAGRWLAALTVGDDVRVADLNGGGPSQGLDLTGITGRGRSLATLAFGRDSVLGVADRSGAIGLWNAERRQRESVLLGHDDQVNDLSFSADGRWLASISRDGTTRLWELEMPGTHPWVFGGGGGDLRDLALAGPRPWLVAAGSNGKVRRIDVAGPRVPTELPAAPELSPFSVVSASDDGRWLAAGREDGTLLLSMDPFGERPYLPRELTRFAEPVTAVAFSRDNRWLASGSDDGTVRLWHVGPNGPQEPNANHRHSGEVTDLSFSPDSRWLATGSAMGDVLVWQLSEDASRIAPKPLPGVRSRVMALAFDRSGQLALALDDGNVRVWDANKTAWAREPWNVRFLARGADRTVSRTTEYVNDLAFSPDGQWLIVGTTDHRLLRLPMARAVSWGWFINRWTNDAERNEPAQLSSSSAAVTAVTFTPDGRIVSGNSDGTARIGPVDGSHDPVILWGPTQKIWKLQSTRGPTAEVFIAAIAGERAWVWSVGRSDAVDSGGRDHMTRLACRAVSRLAGQTCTELEGRLNGLPGWDVCQVCLRKN